MQRRDFLKLAGLGLGAALMPLPAFSVPISESQARTPLLDFADKKALADVALNTAKSLGATYCDVRIGRYLNQAILTRENRVQGIVNTQSFGVGVRLILNGTWGFASTNNVTPDGIRRVTQQAAAIAKANSRLQKEPVKLAPQAGQGERTWRTPIKKNAFEVPIADKVNFLLAVNAEAMNLGIRFVNSQLFMVNEQKFFASTDGSYIDQDVHRIYPTFTVTAVDIINRKFQTRNALSMPCGMGYEYLEGDASEKQTAAGGVTTLYKKRYDMIEDIRQAAKQVQEKLSAKSVEAGKYDLVLDPSHLWLTIHESVGHPLELDRVLGYEANYAGTSFATLDKWRSKSFKYGSPIVNFFADKTQEGSLGYVGWDDEGVPTKRWDLVKDGILVNYQAIRDQVHIIDQQESHGCCYAQSWADVQFQRMPNVSLAPGKTPLTPEEIIKDVEKGIYIIGDGSFSIDQQRYNFQFGGQLFYEIRNGKIVGMLRDVAYQANTQEFWNSCVAICDERDFRLGGAFNDGKGQPPQSNAVSHGSATALFKNVNVINTARNI
ncbi:MAG: TldD/PmbA family protein [Chloroherpetonaceae bacterium]|nr:TldD/PmbA family protein [Chloroherpetonaceae bacterium]MCS7212392.1 TldD/PmbA family protein [Chloroherpetonaceae bacterium]MDW8020946.1 TldD/PmbA family protein [Chloroherpetonaceae bacterium]